MANTISIDVQLNAVTNSAEAQLRSLKQQVKDTFTVDSKTMKDGTKTFDALEKKINKLKGKTGKEYSPAQAAAIAKEIESLTEDFQKIFNIFSSAPNSDVWTKAVQGLSQELANARQEAANTKEELDKLQKSFTLGANASTIFGSDEKKRKATRALLNRTGVAYDENTDVATFRNAAAARRDAARSAIVGKTGAIELNKLVGKDVKIDKSFDRVSSAAVTDAVTKLVDSSKLSTAVSNILNIAIGDAVAQLNADKTLNKKNLKAQIAQNAEASRANIGADISTSAKALEAQLLQRKDIGIPSLRDSLFSKLENTSDTKDYTDKWEKLLSRLPDVDRAEILDKVNSIIELKKIYAELGNLPSINLKGLDLKTFDKDFRGFASDSDFNSFIDSTTGSLADQTVKDALKKALQNSTELRKTTNAADVQKQVQDIVSEVMNRITGGVDVKDIQQAQTDANALDAVVQNIDNNPQFANIQQQIQQQQATIQNLEQQVKDLEAKLAQQQEQDNKQAQRDAQRETGEGGQKAQQTSNNIRGIVRDTSALAEAESVLKRFTDRWFSLRAVINTVSRTIRSVISDITQLDKTMNDISIVTNMTTAQLWDQIETYEALANQYGVSVNGAYEVSKIFYQQGLQTNEVMKMTEESLKMAKIAGMDYATAANYITTAINGFKINMEDASKVTDVWAALAANTAVSTDELAVAISKTASSAESVGASFESTSAMIATMTAATRESATSIGTSLKSIIARVGEMKTSTTGLIDEDGATVSLNKIDAALQGVGVSMKNELGQMRDFDDIILELGERWESLDRNTQRYLATLIAGNRQQPRLLALLSNIDKYKDNLNVAMNAEATGDMQAGKALDSIQTKIQLIKTELQSLYRESGLEDAIKGILDFALNALQNLKRNVGSNIGLVIVTLLNNFTTIKTLLLNSIKAIKLKFKDGVTNVGDNATQQVNSVFERLNTKWTQFIAKVKQDIQNVGNNAANNPSLPAENNNNPQGNPDQETPASNKKKLTSFLKNNWTTIAQIAGTGLSVIGATRQRTSYDTHNNSGIISGIGNGLSGIANGALLGSAFGPIGAAIGGIAGAIPGLIEVIKSTNVTLTERIKLAAEETKKAKEEMLEKKAVSNDLQSAVDKYKALEAAQYDSAEAAEEYYGYMAQLKDTYGDLTAIIDAQGNTIVNLSELERKLAIAREETATATLHATQAELHQSILEGNKVKQRATAFTQAWKYRGWVNIDVNDSNFMNSEAFTILNSLGDNNKSLSDLDDNQVQVILNTFANMASNSNGVSVTDNGIEDILRSMIAGMINSGDYTDEEFQNITGSKQDAIYDPNLSLKELYRIFASLVNNVRTSLSKAELYTESLVQQLVVDKLKNNSTIGLNDQNSWIGNIYSKRIQYTDENNPDMFTNWDIDDATGTFSDYAQGQYDLIETDVKTLTDSFSKLNKKAQAKVTEIILNASQYTSEEINKELEKAGIDVDNNEWKNLIDQTIDDAYDSVNDALVQVIDEYGITIGKLWRANGETFTINENKLSADVIDSLTYNFAGIAQMYEDGLVNQATSAMTILEESVNTLTDESVSDEVKNKVKGLVLQTDFSSYESVEQLIRNLNEVAKTATDEEQKVLSGLAEELTDDLKEWPRSIALIFTTAIDTLAATGESIKDISDKIVKGQSLQDMRKNFNLIDDMSFEEFAEFDASLGQWVYTAAGSAEMLKLKRKELTDSSERLSKVAEELDTIGTKDEKGNVSLTDKGNKLAGSLTQQKDIINDIKDRTDYANEGERYAALQTQLITTLSGLDVEVQDSFLQYVLNYEGPINDFGQLIKDWAEANNQDLSTYQAMIENFDKEQGYYLISSVDFEKYNNNLEYQSRINESLKAMSAGTITSISDWLRDGGDYVSFELKQKYALSKSDILDTAISDLQKGIGEGISETTYEWLQKTLGQDFVSEFIDDNGILKQGAIGTWFALSQAFQDTINEIDAGAPERIAAVTQFNSAIAGVLEAATSSIANGLKGSMSESEKADIISSGIGITERNFKATTDGYSIDLEGAAIFYNYLEKSNVSANELKKTAIALGDALRDNDSNFADMPSIYAEIIKLEKQIEIAADNGNKAQIAGLQKRLKLVREIANAEYTQEDSFSFMDRPLDQELVNPSDYWTNVVKAEKAMASAKSDGYMELEDFNAIVRQTYNSMLAAGATLDDAQTFLTNALHEGTSALGAVNGNYGVVLANLGDTIGTGLEGLTAKFDDNIKAFAKKQVEMLDAQIAAVQALMSMEDMEGLYNDPNGYLDDIGDDPDKKNKLAKFLSSITGINLTTYENWINAFGDDVEKFKEFVVALMEAIGMLDKDPQAVNNVLKDNGLFDKKLNSSVVADTNGDKDGGENLLISDANGDTKSFDLTGTDYDGQADAIAKQLNIINQLAKAVGVDIDLGNLTSIEDIMNLLNSFGNLDLASINPNNLDGYQQSIISNILANSIIKTDIPSTYTYVTNEGERTENQSPEQIEQDIADETYQKIQESFGGDTTVIKNDDGYCVICEVEGGIKVAAVVKDTGNGTVTISSFGKEGRPITIDNLENEGFVKGVVQEQANMWMEENGFNQEQTIETGKTEYMTVNALLSTDVNYQDNGSTYTISAFGESKTYPSGYNVTSAFNEMLNDFLLSSGVGTDGSVILPDEALDIDKNVDLSSINFTFTSTDGVVSQGLIVPLNSEAISANVRNAITSGLNNEDSYDEANVIPVYADAEVLNDSIQAALNGKTFTVPIVPQAQDTPTPKDDKTETPQTPTNNYSPVSGDYLSQLANLANGLGIINTSLYKDIGSAFNFNGGQEDYDALANTLNTIANGSGTAEEKLALMEKAIDDFGEQIQLSKDRVLKITKVLKEFAATNFKASLEVDVKVKDAENSGFGDAKGNVTSTNGTVNGDKITWSSAKAKGTLMGELGRELVVSGGRYYTVGNNGAEMVNLPDDAIVFNHLQTEQLLGQGRIGGRGKAVTSERKAVALASGNAHAKQDLSSLLASLIDARNAWQSLLDADLRSIATLAGSGGGGGGGGGGNKQDWAGFLGNFERWYNLLRQIEEYEQKINLEEAKRKNLISGYKSEGYEYAENLKLTLGYLQENIDDQKYLNTLRKSYYEQRREDLNASDFSKIFTYDEDGLMQYVDGKNRGLDILATLARTNANGTPVMTSQEQYNYLKSLGFNMSDLEYDTEGKKTTSKSGSAAYFTDIVKNFFDRAQGWQDEMDSLYDDVADGLQSVEDYESQRNDILKEIQENEFDIENELLTALENIRQAQIDSLSDQLNAIKEASDKYTDGLSKALDKEKKMYESDKSSEEIVKLQRQLSILQRTGGSATEIKSLQDELDEKLRDSYFDEQQQSIDALTEAAKNQQDSLQKQIDILTKQLEFEKETGILWAEVHKIMASGEGAMYDTLLEGMNIDRAKSDKQFKDYLDGELKNIQQYLGMSLEEAEGVGALPHGEQSDTQAWRNDNPANFIPNPNSDGNTTTSTGFASDSELVAQYKKYQAALSEYQEVFAEMGLSQNELKELKGIINNKKATQKQQDDLLGRLQDFIDKGKDFGKSPQAIEKATNLQEVLKNSYDEKGNFTGLKNMKWKEYGGKLAQDQSANQQLLSDIYGLADSSKSQEEFDTAMTSGSQLLFQAVDGKMGKVGKGGYFVITGFDADLSNYAKDPSKFEYQYYDSKGQIKTGTATEKTFNTATGQSFGTLIDNLRKDILGNTLNSRIADMIKLKKFASGGLIDFTGPAWVDGSSSRPESILDASDTSFLQELLSNSSNSSLQALIGSITRMTDKLFENETLQTTSIYGDINLTIQSGTISDDYSARRAGQLAMEEIMKIARKSGNISLKRG